MTIRRVAFVAVALVLMVGIPSVVLAANFTIQGNVNADLRNGQPLGSDATLYVRLDNITTGTPVPVTEFVPQGLVSGKQQPYSYNLTADIPATGRYRVVAEIANANKNRLYRGESVTFSLAASGTTTAPLIAAGPSFGRLGDPSSGTWRIAAALALVAAAGGIALWRRSRTLRLARRTA